ncbi:8632_t:CDS:2 [Funneliformis caledonium]|uniref:8632_t:CDS:1 n=1 Tax=Funneliformis caledonium TaxID=1117310 RepID=A0A9N9G3X8_9GLOM|nr:8632_t:CDS:2 [Funneliformis caledonium]
MSNTNVYKALSFIDTCQTLGKIFLKTDNIEVNPCVVLIGQHETVTGPLHFFVKQEPSRKRKCDYSIELDYPMVSTKRPIFHYSGTLPIYERQIFNTPASINCLFEVKIRVHEALGLMVIKYNKNWGGYEFKVVKISAPEFEDPVRRAEKYAEYFDMRI